MIHDDTPFVIPFFIHSVIIFILLLCAIVNTHHLCDWSE